MDKETIKFAGLAILFVVSFVFFVLLGSNAVDKLKCTQYHNATGRSIKFVFWPAGQCYVNTSNGWVLKDQIQIRSN